jgi:hypothetical protein
MARVHFGEKHLSDEMTILTILLAAILAGGAIFLLIPTRVFVGAKEKELSLSPHRTSDIQGIVMFVSKRRNEERLEDVLAYKILSHMATGKNPEKKRAWLIHGGTVDEPGSSYRNTVELITRFKDSGIKLKPVGIDDIFDANESFKLVNDIFARQLYGMNSRQVICDFTSGTKLMTLGMALACAGDKKLVYFPEKKEADAAEYQHVDTQTIAR